LLQCIAGLTFKAAEQVSEDGACLCVRSLHPRGKVMV
jgi:hypothetical protein